MYLRAKIVYKQLKKQPIFIALKIGEFLRRNYKTSIAVELNMGQTIIYNSKNYKTSIAENAKGEVQKNLQ